MNPCDCHIATIPGPASDILAAADLLDELEMSYTVTELLVTAAYLNRKENR